MKEYDEFINLIDLGKTIEQSNFNRNHRNENLYLNNCKFIENQDNLNEKLINNLDQSALFKEFNLIKMNNDENNQIDLDLNLKELNKSTELNKSNEIKNLDNQIDPQLIQNEQQLINRSRKSIIKTKFKNLSINNTVLNSRNNYEKLTDSLLINTDNSKYYGSFSKAKQSKINETTFTNILTDDTQSLNGNSSINSQNLINIYLKEFENEKHLNLVGFKTILIVILSFCFLISFIFAFKVYFELTDNKLLDPKFIDPRKTSIENIRYWKVTWIINSFITLFILLIGIIGLLKEKVILILITSVCMMLSISGNDDPITDSKKIFKFSILIILSTSVLLIIFAARLRCYAEDKLNLINKIQYNVMFEIK